jgi:multidrug resistance efflux pump
MTTALRESEAALDRSRADVAAARADAERLTKELAASGAARDGLESELNLERTRGAEAVVRAERAGRCVTDPVALF